MTMRTVQSKPLMRDIRQAQPDWFSEANKRFFADRAYYCYYSKATGNPYLVRSTYMWSDMFGKPKTLCYRINPVDPQTKRIGMLEDEIFDSLADAKRWLSVH